MNKSRVRIKKRSLESANDKVLSLMAELDAVKKKLDTALTHKNMMSTVVARLQKEHGDLRELLHAKNTTEVDPALRVNPSFGEKVLQYPCKGTTGFNKMLPVFDYYVEYSLYNMSYTVGNIDTGNHICVPRELVDRGSLMYDERMVQDIARGMMVQDYAVPEGSMTNFMAALQQHESLRR